MKFCKQYLEFIRREGQCKLPGCRYVEFKRFKKILKKCPAHDASNRESKSDCTTGKELLGLDESEEDQTILTSIHHLSRPNRGIGGSCSPSCAVCDGKFFPELMEEVSAIVGCFEVRAKQLLGRHLAKGMKKHLLKLRYGYSRDHLAMIEEGKTLVGYASINAMAIRKILKKYNKIHCAAAEQTQPKALLLAKRVELLQSPWLIELSAFHLNLSDEYPDVCLPEGFEDCSGDFDSGKPTISWTLYDSMKMEVDLSCSICLDTVFDPIALGCGHVYCHSCACSAASIPAFLGTKVADRMAKCPLCRQEGVYGSAVPLPELGILIKKRCKKYWGERLQKERGEQVHEAKAYWDKQLQAALGV